MSILKFLFVLVGIAFLVWFVLWVRFAGKSKVVGNSDEVLGFLKHTKLSLWYFPHYLYGLIPGVNSMKALILNREKYRPKREILIGADGAEFGIDWFTPKGSASDEPDTLPDDAPILVIEHGLSGGSSERYVQQIGLRARRELGWRSVCVIFRGCCGTHLTTSRPYNAGQTDDFHVALKTIHQRYPKAPLLLIAYSVGSNAMIKYLGEQFTSRPLRTISPQMANKEGIVDGIVCAVAVGCPFDIQYVVSHYPPSLALTTGTQLFRYLKKNSEAIDKDPRYSTAIDDFEKKGDFNVMTVDNYFADLIGGYRDAEDYHTSSSCLPCLEGVTIPLLFITARNDPVSVFPAFPSSEITANKKLGAIIVPGGAHLGFFSFFNTKKTFDEEFALEFFKYKLNELKSKNEKKEEKKER